MAAERKGGSVGYSIFRALYLPEEAARMLAASDRRIALELTYNPWVSPSVWTSHVRANQLWPSATTYLAANSPHPEVADWIVKGGERRVLPLSSLVKAWELPACAQIRIARRAGASMLWLARVSGGQPGLDWLPAQAEMLSRVGNPRMIAEWLPWDFGSDEDWKRILRRVATGRKAGSYKPHFHLVSFTVAAHRPHLLPRMWEEALSSGGLAETLLESAAIAADPGFVWAAAEDLRRLGGDRGRALRTLWHREDLGEDDRARLALVVGGNPRELRGFLRTLLDLWQGEADLDRRHTLRIWRGELLRVLCARSGRLRSLYQAKGLDFADVDREAASVLKRSAEAEIRQAPVRRDGTEPGLERPSSRQRTLTPEELLLRVDRLEQPGSADLGLAVGRMLERELGGGEDPRSQAFWRCLARVVTSPAARNASIGELPGVVKRLAGVD